MEKGLFITFEGADGSGKTTQLNKIKDYLLDSGFDVVVTREPGALDIGQKIRNILLHHEGFVSDRCEMFLFLADRSQHVDAFIKPAVENGKIVLCDRHTDSTVAYQGYGRGQDIELLKKLNEIAVNGLQPDLTLLFDVSTQTAQNRVGDTKDRMEAAGLDFHSKVRNGYLELQKENPDRIKIVDANKDIDTVFENTKNIILKLIQERRGIMTESYRRWYDADPILKEALELLQLQTDDTKSVVADYIISLQEQVAQDVIERIYDITRQFAGKGNRWYDSDPVMLKAIELLRAAPPKTQRIAALKLLLAMENNNPEELEKTDKNELE